MSGWLNTLPRSWQLLPAKAIFTERREPGRAEDPHLTPSQQFGVLPQSEYMERTGGQVVLSNSAPASMKRVYPDDFIIHLRSFQGGIEWSPIPGRVSPAYTVLSPTKLADARYFRWLLKSSAYVQELRTTTNQLRDGQAIGYRDFARVALPAPPRNTQEKIADYLDRETAQIDTLIAKQEQLVSVLEERRALVIAETTAGRRKGAVLRASAVEWLGQIDAQWPVVRVRHVADVGTGYGDTVDADPNGRYPFYVRSQTPQRSDEFDHFGPAVLTAGDGAGVAKVFHLATGKFKAHQRVYVIDGFRNVLPEYFLAYFSAYFNRVALDGSAKSTVDSVRRPMITDMPIPLPPLDEQRRIVAYLDEQTAKIDALIAKAERFIELAKERRAALITAAVTGQLDVTAA